MVTIYAIVNDVNGKHYIGCTTGKPQKRWREHRCLLRAGKHVCAELQADWKALEIRCGEADSFFHLQHIDSLFDDAPVSLKRQLELRWMDWFAECGLLYNTNRISFQPPPGAPVKAVAARVANGYRPSAESNLKRRLAQLGKPKAHGAKISATKQARKHK